MLQKTPQKFRAIKRWIRARPVARSSKPLCPNRLPAIAYFLDLRLSEHPLKESRNHYGTRAMSSSELVVTSVDCLVESPSL
jgi:hypothetical protein